MAEERAEKRMKRLAEEKRPKPEAAERNEKRLKQLAEARKKSKESRERHAAPKKELMKLKADMKEAMYNKQLEELELMRHATKKVVERRKASPKPVQDSDSDDDVQDRLRGLKHEHATSYVNGVPINDDLDQLIKILYS